MVIVVLPDMVIVVLPGMVIVVMPQYGDSDDDRLLGLDEIDHVYQFQYM